MSKNTAGSTFGRFRARAVIDDMDKATGAPRIDLLNLAELDPDPDNHRQDIGNEPHHSPEARAKFQELVESIKHEGLLDPIKVLHPDGTASKYRIRDGHRRYYACMAAGMTEADCIIRHQEKSRLRIGQLISNVMQQRPNPWEIARAIDQAMAEGLTQADVAESLGKSRTWVVLHRGILEYPQQLQDALKAGVLRNINTARELAKLEPDALTQELARIEAKQPASRSSQSPDPSTESTEEKPKRLKKAKPLEIPPSAAEALLVRIRSYDPTLFGCIEASEELPDRSRRAVAFRKLFESVLQAAESPS